MGERFIFNDGGRRAAGYKGETDDCVCRAIAIITKLPYQEVYDTLNKRLKAEKAYGESSSRTGVCKASYKKYLADLGFHWKATMFFGQGCKVHLKAEELPKGRLVVQVSRHLVAMIDGVIYDTHDCSRGGKRCVYGFWWK